MSSLDVTYTKMNQWGKTNTKVSRGQPQSLDDTIKGNQEATDDVRH